MKEHKKDWGPGYRFFECRTCCNEWKEKSRDCSSLSCSCCAICGEEVSPFDNEPHYDWSTDNHGNLLEE